MAAPTMYYGNYQFVPVPLFTWSTETAYDGAGDRIVLRHTCDFAGHLLSAASDDGSLTTMIQKRDALKSALASGYQEWTINNNGTYLVSGVYPRVTNIQFDEGVWVDRLNYSFTFTYDEDFYSHGIQGYSENWSFDETEDRRTVSVNHSISAVGLNTATSGSSNAFANAKTFVLAKSGYNHLISGAYGFVQPSGTTSAYEELRSEQVDVQGGSFSISENFTLSSGTYIHTSTGQLAIDDQGVYTVSIDGNIRGLGRGDSAYSRALAGWALIRDDLPATASGIYTELGGLSTLYTSNYNSFSITRNRFTGTISYNVSYTDSAAENLPSGILEFSFNVQDNKPVRLYASFPIMERALGNVVQDIATSTEGTYTISGNASCKQDYNFNDLIAYVEDKINARRPSSINYQTLRLSSKSVTKDEDNKTINWNLTWTYTVELSQAAIDGTVTL